MGSLTKEELEVEDKSDGRERLVKEEDCGAKNLIGEKGSVKCKNKKIRQKVLEKVTTKKEEVNSSPWK